CPFCAYGVEKKLLAVPGVARIEVLINEGKIILALAEGATLDVTALDAAVEKAGFTLRGLLVRDALGTLSRGSGDELLLTSSDPRAIFLVKFDEEDTIPAVDLGRGATDVLASGTVTDFDSRPVQLIATEIKPQRDGSGRLP
ncbi:MAG: heavy-metal-associated domain-containing protein, partial [Myxococcota bacterium]